MKKGTYLVVIATHEEEVKAVSRMSTGDDYVLRPATFKIDFPSNITYDEVKQQEYGLFLKCKFEDKFNYKVLSLPV
jgi:hypothetical protein